MTSSIFGAPRQYCLLAVMRTKSPFLDSATWKGPVPTIGGSFWNDVSAAFGLILLQMCSGTMGTTIPSMLALGLAVVNLHREVVDGLDLW